jgi:pyridoxamine 5'-phosphate oxidase
MDLHNIRETYKFDSLDEQHLLNDPIDQFRNWLESYQKLGVKDYNAMAIATVSPSGVPENRIVLLKEVRAEGLVFYTNYNSHKGQSIAASKLVSSLFFWREQERQVRITGQVEKIDVDQSKDYFKTRPYLSQIGAAASEQSEPIESRSALEAKFNSFMKEYPEGSKVPMPEDWGGYLIRPNRFEFWQGREGRLHDRLIYSLEDSLWVTSRIQP